jgi:broad specificity phosphatase PhoE
MSDDYDRLSPLGKQQGALLGDYWGKRGKLFQRVHIGPLRRHQQTFDAFASGYEAHGLHLPQPSVLDQFSEHSGFSMTRTILPILAETDDYVAQHYNDGDMEPRIYLKVFRYVMLKWAAGDVGHREFETWQAFRATVNRGVELVREQTGRGQTSLVFTSGGTISAAVGYALELDDVKAITLNWIVRNTAYAEFSFQDEMFSLTEFNAIPHIDDDHLHTYV